MRHKKSWACIKPDGDHEMTPQEKLKKIESEISDKYHHVLDFKDASWLIARVEQLEEALCNISSFESGDAVLDVAHVAIHTGPKPGAQE